MTDDGGSTWILWPQLLDQACALASKDQDDNKECYLDIPSTSGAVILAVASFEAYLSEVAWWTAGKGRSLEKLLQEDPKLVESGGLKERICRIALLHADRKPDFSKEPWQSFSLLVRLRNKVVHYKSKSYLPGEGPGKLVKCFAELQLIDVPCDNDVDAHWCELVLVPSVGSWACVTVGRAMVDYNRVTKMYRPVVKKYVDDSLSTLKYSM